MNSLLWNSKNALIEELTKARDLEKYGKLAN